MSFRVALCGTSGSGKTSLAQALGDRWGVPVLQENLVPLMTALGALRKVQSKDMADYHAPGQAYLGACNHWLRERHEQMLAAKGGFVADRWAMDILIRYLASDLGRILGPKQDGLVEAFFKHVHREARQLDAVVLLPLPLRGVPANNEAGLRRRTDLAGRLHSHALVVGLLSQVRVPQIHLPNKVDGVYVRANHVERLLKHNVEKSNQARTADDDLDQFK